MALLILFHTNIYRLETDENEVRQFIVQHLSTEQFDMTPS